MFEVEMNGLNDLAREAVKELEPVIKRRYEEKEAGSKEKEEAYYYLIQLQYIYADRRKALESIRKNKDTEEIPRLLQNSQGIYKRCLAYYNEISGVLF